MYSFETSAVNALSGPDPQATSVLYEAFPEYIGNSPVPYEFTLFAIGFKDGQVTYGPVSADVQNAVYLHNRWINIGEVPYPGSGDE